MKKIFKALAVSILSICIFIGCSSQVSSKEKEEIKKAVDIVLSNNGIYGEEVSKYISEDNYYTSNYYVFYSMFLGEVKLTKYESELKSVIKSGGKYTACFVIDMEAIQISTDNNDDGNNQKPDTATGDDVPVEVILEKKDKEFYIIKTKEYDSLEQAINNNEGFK